MREEWEILSLQRFIPIWSKYFIINYTVNIIIYIFTLSDQILGV